MRRRGCAASARCGPASDTTRRRWKRGSSVFAMIETARGPCRRSTKSAPSQGCPASTSARRIWRSRWGTAWPRRGPQPRSRDAMPRIQASASAAGLVAGIHAGDGQDRKGHGRLGFRMITLASESQALRRGAGEHLGGDRRRPRWRPRRGTVTDRVALVTGAARGQGAAIVKRLRADGFRVAACDLLADELKAPSTVLGDARRSPSSSTSRPRSSGRRRRRVRRHDSAR